MKKTYTLLLFLLFYQISFSQEYLSGTIVDDENNPIARAEVKIFDGDDNLISTRYSDTDGSFTTNVEIQSVTSLTQDLLKKETLSLIYPNPATGGPLHFQYHSSDSKIPVVNFFTLQGKMIENGAFILPGNYVYSAYFPGNEDIKYSGMFTTSQSMHLTIELHNDVTTGNQSSPGYNSRGRMLDNHDIRVEIEKFGFVTYEQSTTVNNSELIDKTFTLNSAPEPSADFSIIADNGQIEKQIIKFDATSSSGANGEDLTYSWSFGDQSQAGGSQVPHVFDQAGEYQVILTVTGDYGATTTLEKTVTISENGITPGSAAILGEVLDVNGNPIEKVAVYVPSLQDTFYTDIDGEVGINGFLTGQQEMITIFKDGYIAENRQVTIQKDESQGYFKVALIQQEAAIAMNDVELGGQAEGKDGTFVLLPIEGLVDSDGNMVTGQVETYLTPIDISDPNEIEAFPGEFNGVDFDGPVDLILSYGTADYTFMQHGEKLQLAPGKTALLRIPIYATTDENGNELTTGMEFPMWSYNEQSGNWIREGLGTVVSSENSPSSLAFEIEVTHFSWWNHDIAPDPYLPIPECKINDKSGLPTLEIPDGGSCYLDGEIEGPGGPRGRPSQNGCCTPLPIPPNVDFNMNGSGGNGLYKGSVTLNGPAGVEETVTIVLEPVFDPNNGGPIEADTSFTSGINEVGEIDNYTFPAEAGNIYVVAVSSGSGSNLSGRVKVRDSDNLPIGIGTFNANTPVSVGFVAEKSGTYSLEIDGLQNEPGAYQVKLEGLAQVELNSENTGELLGRGDISQFAFEGKQDQLVNIVYASNKVSGRIYLNVFDPEGNRMYRDRSEVFDETDVRSLPSDGIYKIVISGVDTNSKGEFQLALATIEEPEIITLESPYTTREGEIENMAKKYYYQFEANAMERILAGFYTTDNLAGNYKMVKNEDGKPFYQGQRITDMRTTLYNTSAQVAQTSPFVLSDAGTYTIEVESGFLYNLKKGTYQIYLGNPEITSITLNSETDNELAKNLDRYRDFDSYQFSGNAGDLINPLYLSEINGRIYLDVFDSEGNQIRSERGEKVVEESVPYKLPADDTYTIIIWSVDNNSYGDYTLGLASIEEPEAVTLTTPFLEISEEITQIGDKNYYKFNASENDRLRMGLLTSNGLLANAQIGRPDDKPFYEKNRQVDINSGRLSGIFDLAPDEYIIEVDPVGLGAGNYKGAYRIYVARPEVESAAFNQVIERNFAKDLGAFLQYDLFTIEGASGESINIDFRWKEYKSVFGPRVYIRVYAPDESIVYNKRFGVNDNFVNTGNINLSQDGTYRIELQPVDSGSVGDYEFRVNK